MATENVLYLQDMFNMRNLDKSFRKLILINKSILSWHWHITLRWISNSTDIKMWVYKDSSCHVNFYNTIRTVKETLKCPRMCIHPRFHTQARVTWEIMKEIVYMHAYHSTIAINVATFHLYCIINSFSRTYIGAQSTQWTNNIGSV